MSNDGTATFLPFEALGDRSKPRGHSSMSNVMQPWYTRGASYGSMEVAMTLPSLTMTGRVRNDDQTEIIFTLPSLTMQAYFGWTVTMPLPSMKLAATMNIPRLMRITMKLPALQASADMLTGSTEEVLMTLQPLVFFMRFGWSTGFSLPALKMSAHMIGANSMSAVNMHLQPLQLVAHLTRTSEVMHITMVLPALQGAAPRTEASIVLPALRMHAHFQNDRTKDVTQAWAWNVHKNTMTRYTNYAYKTFIRFNNAYYGVGYDGVLYKLDGDTDAGKPIGWAWETGFDDMDSPAEKGILGVYIAGQIERGAEFTIRTDINVVRVYRTHTDERAGQSDFRTYRVVPGKGVRSNTFALGMQSSLGGAALITRVAPMMVISKRNI